MNSDLAPLSALSTLGDPVRRQLYEIVASQCEPIGRDDAASAAGIGRSLAIYHLDKLVESGLLEVSYRRLTGRSGPGAGRPAKLYRRPDRELSISVPARQYELAARLLAQAVDSDPGGASRAALRDAAFRFGKEQKRSCTSGLTDILAEHGYEPVTDPDGEVRLRNCPFHQLADQHRDVVCGMNLALIEGMITGLPAAGHHARLDPRPGYCCVTIGTDLR